MTVDKVINIKPKRILVITLRYLGDTLLVTPLLSSLHAAYPEAEIDVLMPVANVSMLEGNSDVHELITLPKKPGFIQFLKILIKLYRKYDLSISTQAGDRPVLAAIIAGKTCIGFVPNKSWKQCWKNGLLTRSLLPTMPQKHSVLENLRFCQVLGIQASYRVTPPRLPKKNVVLRQWGSYAVLHIMPQWRYKQWHEKGWIELAHYLHHQGYQIVLTGSSDSKEVQIIKNIQNALPPSTRNVAGKMTLAELVSVIEHAELFVGPDTGITHLASATGVPCFALFGPTDPQLWGPWPIAYSENKNPFIACGNQINSNVIIIQGGSDMACVPCQEEGCYKHRESESLCLMALPTEKVITIINSVVRLKKQVTEVGAEGIVVGRIQ